MHDEMRLEELIQTILDALKQKNTVKEPCCYPFCEKFLANLGLHFRRDL